MYENSFLQKTILSASLSFSRKPISFSFFPRLYAAEANVD